MRKLLVTCLVAGLVAGALAVPATAKKKAAPVTFYFHGPYPVGEADHAENTANSLQSIPDGFQVMDTTEPSDAAPDSMGLINYVQGPNASCNGNGLFPTWQGSLIGKVSGDMKIYLNAIAGATNVTVDVFADTVGGCTSTVTGANEYIDPVASVDATLAQGLGETEIVLEDVSFATKAHIVVMVTPTETDVNGETKHDPSSQGRVLYDSVDFLSRVELLCTPTSGKSCVPAS